MEHSGSQSCSDFGSQRSQERSEQFLPNTFSPIKIRDFGQLESSSAFTDFETNENDKFHFEKVLSSQEKLDNFILNYQRGTGYCSAEIKEEKPLRRISTIRKSFRSSSILSDSSRKCSNSCSEDNNKDSMITVEEHCSSTNNFCSPIKSELTCTMRTTDSTDKRKGKRKITYPESPATPVKSFQRELHRKTSAESDVEGSPSFASDFMC